MRFVSGGCDHTVKFWTYNESSKKFSVDVVTTHKDWVRDVAFAGNLGLGCETVASCSEDRTVVVSKRVETADKRWTEVHLPEFRFPVWRVSWSLTGNYLAVAGADNIVYVYEEKTPDKWEVVSEMNQNNVQKPE